MASGDGYFDGGLTSLSLVFLQIDTKFQLTEIIPMIDFHGIPENMGDYLFPEATDLYPLPGRWTSLTEFTLPLNATGVHIDFNPGLYTFDLLSRMAHRIADLP